MKKLFYFALILFIIVSILRFIIVQASATSKYRNVQAQGITNNTEYPTATSTQQPTSTLIPSATIDYQQTAIVAQSTADEARRINSMATAEYVRLLNEQLAMTQVVEQNNFAIMSWTATAALTTIPLTATQQAVNNTQIPAQQNFVISQMSATAYAPTQIVAMTRANDYKKYSWIDNVVGIVAKFAISIFAIGIVVFIFRIPMVNKPEPTQEKESQLETVIWLKNTKDNGAQSTRQVIPCSPEQLTDLAENITQGNTTFGINQWEQVCKTFKSDRDIIHAVRGWLQLNKFAYANGKGELAPSDEGLDFLCGWLESNRLPTEYEFESPHSPEMSSPANHNDLPEKLPINMGNHTHDNGGGGGYPNLAVDNSK